MKKKEEGTNLACSFCGKSQKEVKKLIAGPTVYICDECIELCNDIIAEEASRDSERGSSSVPKPREIKAFLDQYVADLRRYRAIAIDVGDEDRLKADAARLHEALDRYGIPHSFEVYKGTHTSKVADRFQNHVLPFFSRSLCFENDCR